MHRGAGARSKRPVDRGGFDRGTPPGHRVPGRRGPSRSPARGRGGAVPEDRSFIGGGIMIVDVHSHTWSYPDHFDDSFVNGMKIARPGVTINIHVDFDAFMKAMAPC